jgi:toxin ParE1/3/4
MSVPDRRLALSRRASRDLRTIQHYSVRQWGTEQATVNDEALARALTALQDHPNLGQDRSDLVPGLRSYPVGSYMIFYRVAGGTLLVHQILHQRMNVTPEQLA